jgi:predicted transcriptional regulator YheO
MDESTRKQWCTLVEFLGEVLGNTAEILLEEPATGVVAVCNGHLLGHKPGDPLTPQTETVLAHDRFSEKLMHISAVHHPGTGQPMRRYQYFLRDAQGALLAILTVTVDTSEYLAVINSLSKLVGQAPNQPPQILVNTDEKCGAISSALVELGLSHVEPHRLTESEVVALIRLLNQNGVFQARGAVAEIASQLQISESTVYRHLTAVTRHQKAEQRATRKPDKEQ